MVRFAFGSASERALIAFFGSRPRVPAVSERDQEGVAAKRDNVDRHGQGAVRPVLPEAADHGVPRLADGEDLHPRLE